MLTHLRVGALSLCKEYNQCILSATNRVDDSFGTQKKERMYNYFTYPNIHFFLQEFYYSLPQFLNE